MNFQISVDSRGWHYFSSTAVSFICLFLGVFSGILTARLLGPTGRGELAILAYFPTLVGGFFSLGLPEAVGFLINHRRHDRDEVISASIHLSLTFGLVGASCFAFVASVWLADNSGHLIPAAVMSSLCAVAMAVNPTLSFIHRNTGSINLVNLVTLFIPVVYCIVLSVFFLIGLHDPSVVNLSALAIQSVVMVFYIWKLGFYQRFQIVSKSAYLLCLSHGRHFFLPALVLTVFGLIDRSVLISRTTLEQIGFYAIGISISTPVALVIEAFAYVGFVEVAGAEGPVEKTRIMVTRFQVAQLVVVLTAFAVGLLLPYLIRYGFGTTFSPVIPVAYWLVATQALRGLNKMLNHYLRATNCTLSVSIAYMIGLIMLFVITGLLSRGMSALEFTRGFFGAHLIVFMFLVYSLARHCHLPLRSLWGLRVSSIRLLLIGMRNLFLADSQTQVR